MDNLITAEQQLDLIDQIRARIPVTYEEANNALDKTGGNLIDALALLENEYIAEQPAVKRRQKIESLISGWIEKGRATRLLVKQNQEVVAQVPVSVGLVGAILSPRLALIGAVAALAGGCRLELEPIKAEASEEDTQKTREALDASLTTGVSEVANLPDELDLLDARVARATTEDHTSLPH